MAQPTFPGGRGKQLGRRGSWGQAVTWPAWTGRLPRGEQRDKYWELLRETLQSSWFSWTASARGGRSASSQGKHDVGKRQPFLAKWRFRRFSVRVLYIYILDQSHCGIAANAAISPNFSWGCTTTIFSRVKDVDILPRTPTMTIIKRKSGLGWIWMILSLRCLRKWRLHIRVEYQSCISENDAYCISESQRERVVHQHMNIELFWWRMLLTLTLTVNVI